PSIYGHFGDRQAILLTLVRDAFAQLSDRLSAAADPAPDSRARLQAVCAAYLDFAIDHPQLYRLMFGGLWNAAAAAVEGALSPGEASELGQDAMGVLAGALGACVHDGSSSSSSPDADAVALWLGLHGLAHQRAV